MQLYSRLRLQPKKIDRVLELNQSQRLKPYIEFNTQKKNKCRKNDDKDGKVLYKLMNNAVYKKAMENLRVNVKLASSKNDYLKWTSKPSYKPHKTFDNDFVAIRKNKVKITLKKPAHIGICIFELGKVLIFEFRYDYIKNIYGNISRL